MPKQASPVYPIPYWFFSEVLMAEKKDVSRVLWALMHRALETNTERLPASFVDIGNWTGLVPDRISESLKTLRHKGFISRIKDGEMNTESTEGRKAVYKINWDYKEVGTKDKVFKLFNDISSKYNAVNAYELEDRDIHTSSSNVAKIMKGGERVRVGRFGEDKKNGTWYSSGYGAVKEHMENSSWGIMIRKVKAGQLDSLTPRDFVSLWEYKYQKKFNSPYIPVIGKDMAIFARLKSTVSSFHIIRMIKWLFDSGQTQFTKPSPGLLASRYATVISDEATAWARKQVGE